MKRNSILTIWIVSFIMVLLFANIMNGIFWISFAVFVACSLYIEKHKERLEKEEDDGMDYDALCMVQGLSRYA